MKNRRKAPFYTFAERFYWKQVIWTPTKNSRYPNLSSVWFHFIAEGRRHGKTVIFAKNVANKRADDDDKIEDSDYDESDSDESMTDGHPSKKQKISWISAINWEISFSSKLENKTKCLAFISNESHKSPIDKKISFIDIHCHSVSLSQAALVLRTTHIHRHTDASATNTKLKRPAVRAYTQCSHTLMVSAQETFHVFCILIITRKQPGLKSFIAIVFDWRKYLEFELTLLFELFIEINAVRMHRNNFIQSSTKTV